MRSALTESLELDRELGYREVIAYVLSGLAELALLEQENEALAQHRILTELYATLGEERTDELRVRGATTPVDELVG